jgi:hypothetical protein
MVYLGRPLDLNNATCLFLRMSIEMGKSVGDKTISTKIPREEFTRLQYLCKQNNETVNAALKRMVLYSITDPKPIRIAGKSIFDYDTTKDNFEWKIKLDDGSEAEIDRNFSVGSLEHLLASLLSAIKVRNSYLRKSRKESVPFPTGILRS